MPRKVTGILAAISDLQQEWGELVALRRSVRSAPFDEETERHMVARLRSHQNRLRALRTRMLKEADGEPVGPAPRAMRPVHTAH